MARGNRDIRDYWKTSQQSSGDRVGVVVAPKPAVKLSAGLVIQDSDEEDANSDSSLPDLCQFAAKRPCSLAKGPGLSSNSSVRSGKGRGVSINISPPKQKYHFDMEALVRQAEIHKAADASALRMKVVLEDNIERESQSNSREISHDNMLKSVVAEQDGTDVNKVLQAVKRTEAIRSEKRWYFFNSKQDIHVAQQFPMNEPIDGWKARLVEPRSREQFVLSGFARDMVVLGDTLPDEVFSWMLNEICLERRDDLREAYCRILAASTQQIRRLISLETMESLFKLLGGTAAAVKISENTGPLLMDHSPYKSPDWTVLRTVIDFVGRVSEYLCLETCSYTLCLLLRLCIDGMFVEDICLLSTLQKTMEQVSRNIEAEYWEKICEETCASTFKAVDLPALQLQVLRCIPQTTARVHELRRRLALAFFFNDITYTSRTTYDALSLSKVITRLAESRFKINRDANYHEIAALISVLDIAVGNGLSFEHTMDPKGEISFNLEVDDLAACIKKIWSSINDAGASFMSRINAKEVMQGFRMRLEHAVRTEPKPKLSIFESDLVSDEKGIQKQWAFMDSYLKKSWD